MSDRSDKKDYSNFTPEQLAEHCAFSDIRKIIYDLSPREVIFSAVLGNLTEGKDEPMRVRLGETLKEISKALDDSLENAKKNDKGNKNLRDKGVAAGEGVNARIIGEPRAALDAAILMTESPHFTYYHAISQQLDLMKETRRVLTDTCVGAMDFFTFLATNANDKEMAEAYWNLVVSKAFLVCLRQFQEYFTLHMLLERAQQDYDKLSDLRKFKASNLNDAVRKKYFDALRDLIEDTKAVKSRMDEIKVDKEDFDGIEDLDAVLESIERATLSKEDNDAEDQ